MSSVVALLSLSMASSGMLASDMAAGTNNRTEQDERSGRRLFVGAEYLLQRSYGTRTDPSAEVVLPHGILDYDEHASLNFQPGWVVSPPPGIEWALPIYLGLSYEPLGAAWSPFVGVGFGGHLVSPGSDADPSKTFAETRWAWGARARAGLRLSVPLYSALSIRAFTQASWVESVAGYPDSTFSGWGLGLAVEYVFAAPKIGIMRKLTHGEGAPQGW